MSRPIVAATDTSTRDIRHDNCCVTAALVPNDESRQPPRGNDMSTIPETIAIQRWEAEGGALGIPHAQHHPSES